MSRLLSLFGEKEARILVLGLDNAGKTTILCESTTSSPSRTLPTRAPPLAYLPRSEQEAENLCCTCRSVASGGSGVDDPKCAAGVLRARLRVLTDLCAATRSHDPVRACVQPSASTWRRSRTKTSSSRFGTLVARPASGHTGGATTRTHRSATWQCWQCTGEADYPALAAVRLQ
jgi:GTPase SAR1 family protein